MSDGTILKADKDYTKDVDSLLPEAEKTAKVGINS
jgi:26S proteasome regulatory subunit N5